MSEKFTVDTYKDQLLKENKDSSKVVEDAAAAENEARERAPYEERAAHIKYAIRALGAEVIKVVNPNELSNPKITERASDALGRRGRAYDDVDLDKASRHIATEAGYQMYDEESNPNGSETRSPSEAAAILNAKRNAELETADGVGRGVAHTEEQRQLLSEMGLDPDKPQTL